jgi:hypothetical protein
MEARIAGKGRDVIRDGIFKLLRSPGIDSKEAIPPAYVACVGIFKRSMGARNRVG